MQYCEVKKIFFVTTVSTIPAIERARLRLGELIRDIQQKDSGRQSIKAGKSEIKWDKKNELIAAVYQIASG